MKVKLLLRILILFSLNASAEQILIVGGSHARGVENFDARDYRCKKKYSDNGMLSYFSGNLYPYKLTCFAPDNMIDFLSYVLAKRYLYDQLDKAFEKARETKETSILLLPPCVLFWLVFGGKGNIFSINAPLGDYLSFLGEQRENPFYSFLRPEIVNRFLRFKHSQPNLTDPDDQETIINRVKSFINKVSGMQKNCQASGYHVIVVLSNIPLFLPVFSDDTSVINVLPSVLDVQSESDFSIPFDRTFIDNINSIVELAVQSAENPSICLLDFAKITVNSRNIELSTSIGRYSMRFTDLLSSREEKLNSMGYAALADSMLHAAMQSETWPKEQSGFSPNYRNKVSEVMKALNARRVHNQKKYSSTPVITAIPMATPTVRRSNSTKIMGFFNAKAEKSPLTKGRGSGRRKTFALPKLRKASHPNVHKQLPDSINTL